MDAGGRATHGAVAEDARSGLSALRIVHSVKVFYEFPRKVWEPDVIASPKMHD